jgi:hypothetical protein
MLNDVETIPTRCPYCGYKVDRASHVGEEQASPKPGDVSICMLCANVSLYVDDLGNVRKATPEEVKELEANPTVAKTQLAIRTIEWSKK